MKADDLHEGPRLDALKAGLKGIGGAAADAARKVGKAGYRAADSAVSKAADYGKGVALTALTDMGSVTAREKIKWEAAARDMLKRWKVWTLYNEADATVENLIAFIAATYDTSGGSHEKQLTDVARQAAIKAGLLTGEPMSNAEADRGSPFYGLESDAVRRLQSAKADGADQKTLAVLARAEQAFKKNRPTGMTFGDFIEPVLSQIEDEKQNNIARGHMVRMAKVIAGRAPTHGAPIGADDRFTRERFVRKTFNDHPEIIRAIGKIEQVLAAPPLDGKTTLNKLKPLYQLAWQAANKTSNPNIVDALKTYLSSFVNPKLPKTTARTESAKLGGVMLTEAEAVLRSEMMKFFTLVAKQLIGAGYIKVTGVDQKLKRQRAAASFDGDNEAPTSRRKAPAASDSDDPIARVDLRKAAQAASRELGMSLPEIEAIMRDVRDAVLRNPEVGWKDAMKRVREENKKVTEFLFAYMISKARDVPR